LAEGFQRRRLKCEKLTDDGLQVMAKAHDKNVMKFRVLKMESVNSMMSGSQSFCGSFMIPVTTLIM
jgi:hypothetical protein